MTKKHLFNEFTSSLWHEQSRLYTVEFPMDLPESNAQYTVGFAMDKIQKYSIGFPRNQRTIYGRLCYG